jgi:glycosyltransferase involved in cell wall biosynthesis
VTGVHRVLQVSPRGDRGGAEGIAGRLALELEARGLDSRLAVAYGTADGARVVRIATGVGSPWAVRAGLDLHDRLRDAGRPHAARVARMLAQPAVLLDLLRGREDFRYPATDRILDHLGTPDVLHLHNLHGGYFDLRRLPHLTQSVATVITLHDSWLFTGHCAHPLDGERWRTGCGNCPRLDLYPRLRRDGTAANLRRKRDILSQSRLHLVAPSRWLLDRAIEGIPKAGVVAATVVPNGVDLGVFRPGDAAGARRRLGVPEGASVLVAAANGLRTNDYKDWPTLRAAADVIGADSDDPVVLLVAGDVGEPVRTGRLEIRFLGHIASQSAIADVLRAADLYLHSARADTFPTSVLEALATGVPVVASRVGGIPEQVLESARGSPGTGCLVEQGDPHALGRAVVELLARPGRRIEMAEAAVEDARVRFNLSNMVDRYASVYNDALRTFGTRPTLEGGGRGDGP